MYLRLDFLSLVKQEINGKRKLTLRDKYFLLTKIS